MQSGQPHQPQNCIPVFTIGAGGPARSQIVPCMNFQNWVYHTPLKSRKDIYTRYFLLSEILSATSILHRALFGVMATISRRTRAFFETTRRLLAQLINEGLLHGTVDSSGPFQPVLRLSGPRPCSHGFERYIQVSLVENGCSWTRGFQIQSLLSPSDLQQPVLLVDQDCQVEEICPGEVFYFIRPWLPDGSSEETLLEIAEELRNSARNQGQS